MPSVRPPSQIRWLALIAFALLVLRLFTNTRYGFHRDELALLDDARELAWGYVAYPPLTPALGRISLELFGESLTGFRLFAALAQSISVVLAGLIARELGGGRGAQIVTGLVAALAPFSMVAGGLMQYVSVDYAWWVLLAWLVLRLGNSGDARWWLAIGAAIGLGMLTKYTMVFCVAGVVAATLATPLRAHLRSQWLWMGVALSLLLFLPNALWQWQHDFISLEFLQSIHARDMRIGRTDGFLLGQLYGNAGLLALPLWLLGLGWLVLSPEGRRYRALAWMYAVPLLLFALAQGRAYYLAPAYPMLVAAGCVAAERWLRARRPLRLWTSRLGAVTLSLWIAAMAVGSGLVGLQLAPVNSTGWRISRAAHDNFAEQIGWQDLVAEVARIYSCLTPEERTRTAIFANNYGEAGAINLYGRQYGLPRAISPVNSYWYRGYGMTSPQTVIVLGDDREGMADTPADCVVVTRIRNRFDVPNEETRDHPEVFLCRNLRMDWAEVWPAMRKFG
ncbi:glycosyltransferase family 39 protein [Lysobacter niastensis]|uniref:Glycosyltransferase family 39 protein n=1 Tax=Lysobacter niastensis TaxID=380629 RepID=A0ABS0B2A8_9GAMM|nr:glycosyltransferase family 39 protein [Lysobacter niastensis]MBF6022463.1 glycosyltransferase family 39 protein [Lysobacter niastensis]